MELTRKQFDILEALATNKKVITQRRIEDLTGHSLGTVNRIMKELAELGFVRTERSRAAA